MTPGAQLSLAVVGGSWREFGQAHLPGVLTAGLAGIIAATVSALLRMVDMPPIVILTCVPLVVVATALVAIRYGPRGSYTRALDQSIENIGDMFEGRAASVIRSVLGPTYRNSERHHVDV